MNLCYHHTGFNVTAEWHCFGTSCGKGPSDGVASTVKWLATYASLYPYNSRSWHHNSYFSSVL